MSITGDMIIDYEMASPDEFLDYYGERLEQDYGELEERCNDGYTYTG